MSSVIQSKTDISCRVYNNADISITSGAGALQTLTFNSERFDVRGMHDTSSNTSRIIAPVPGIYMAIANIRFASNATGYRQVFFQVNGSLSTAFGAQIVEAVSTAITDITTTGIVELAASDYVEVVVGQLSGGALNVEYSVSNFISPEFSLFKIN